MKVLHQLITHFWERGVLMTEQAHYLVEHGFVRPWELDQYVPRPAEPAAVAEQVTVPDRSFLEPELLPDELDRQEEALSAPATGRRKGRAAAPRLPDYSLEQLGEQLRGLLDERRTWLPALRELAGSTAEEEAVLLRRIFPSALRISWRARASKPFATW